MEEKQFKKLLEELATIRDLLILNASVSGAKSEDIGKCMGVGGSRIRNILTGVGKKKSKKRSN